MTTPAPSPSVSSPAPAPPDGPQPPSGPLPVTGFPFAPAGIAGLGLIAVGAGMTWAGTGGAAGAERPDLTGGRRPRYPARVDAPVDLRSDTVTKPSEAMRHAMASAEVGDDWYGDDPTVNRLQDRAAELTGRQAAVYLPTGTLCNQIALHAYVRSGHLAVCEATAHAGRTEVSSAAVLSGIAFQYVEAYDRGLLTGTQVAAALAPDPYDVAVIDLVTIENTHQVGGGSVLSVTGVRDIAAVCADAGLPLYLDGQDLQRVRGGRRPGV